MMKMTPSIAGNTVTVSSSNQIETGGVAMASRFLVRCKTVMASHFERLAFRDVLIIARRA